MRVGGDVGLVDGAVAIARSWGLSEAFIGLTEKIVLGGEGASPAGGEEYATGCCSSANAIRVSTQRTTRRTAVAVSADANGTPAWDRMPGLTTMMYIAVRNVVMPATISVRSREPDSRLRHDCAEHP